MELHLIKKVVENATGCGDLSTRNKTHELVMNRWVYFYLAKKYTYASLSAMGEVVGRDHATALYSIRKANEQLDIDRKLRLLIITCEEHLKYVFESQPTLFEVEEGAKLKEIKCKYEEHLALMKSTHRQEIEKLEAEYKQHVNEMASSLTKNAQIMNLLSELEEEDFEPLVTRLEAFVKTRPHKLQPKN